MIFLRAVGLQCCQRSFLATLFAIGLLLPDYALAQTADPAPISDVLLKLPRDLSPWGMFMAADIVVKAVMVGLVFASVLTWTIWFAKAIELLTARRRMQAMIDALSQARSWSDASARMKGRDDNSAALLRAADAELRLSADALSPSGVKERIASRFERIEAAAGRQMIRGTGILATIGATAPFVGLFGTVWGIMNSFIGISKQHTTNLAVVAPGIAEALLATALGSGRGDPGCGDVQYVFALDCRLSCASRRRRRRDPPHCEPRSRSRRFRTSSGGSPPHRRSRRVTLQ